MKNAPIPPTDASAEAFLNRQGDQGNAYRNVKVVRDPQNPGKPLLSHDKQGVASYVATFTPQQRTRFLVPFVRPLQGELLKALLALPKGFERFCQRIEYAVLGCHGTDAACFEPVRVGYLPSGYNGTFYHAILGGPELIDPIPYAEQVIAETEPRAVRKLTVTPLNGDVPENLRKTLKGVRLASLIADNYPELVHRDNGLEPLIMRCCPFCDGHSVKRGQADNSLYCYDPNETPYPTMRCHHRSCAGRKTDEFVDALIESGDLAREFVYEDSQYRDIYVDEPAVSVPAMSRNYKILW